MATRTTTPAEETPGQKIKKLQKGAWVNLGDVEPDGSLSARRLASSVKFYWRFTHAGKTSREEIGLYDSSAPPKSTTPTNKGYSVEAARWAAQQLAQAHRHNIKDGGHAAIKAAEAKAKGDAVAAAERASKYTLSALLDAYCDYQQTLKREDVSDARSIFRLHVKGPFPELASKPAADCRMEDIMPMLTRLAVAKKTRTSNKLRSYLHAAFEVARKSHSVHAIPPEFQNYAIRHNCVGDTAVSPTASDDDKNPLSLDELRLYWRLIEKLPDLRGAVLRVHLLSGGQRIAQLVRAKTAEMDANVLGLWDIKGKAGKVKRKHLVPITPKLKRAIEECKPAGDYVLTTDGGETHIYPTTLSKWAKAVVGDRIPDFDAKRVRSTVETELAREGFNDTIRGRLQSHGITGVQNKHYNAYDYLAEKRQALEVLERLLVTPPTPSVDFGDSDDI